MDNHFSEIKKILGFGCMRLPMKDDEVDLEEFTKMVDWFLDNGFNYFDTAHGYISGKSEKAIKACLTSRYPRDRYILTDKLSGSYFDTEEDVRKIFDEQLEACGVEYFDFYLMHAQNGQIFEKYKKCRAYETAFELKEEGKIRHVGISFHDSPEVLDRILTEYPEIEVVQIQFNYFDYESNDVNSKMLYETCRKHEKPIIVMEPVKGGSLVDIPKAARKYYDDLGDMSYASYAIRFAAGFEGVRVVLSGMSDLDQMKDNVSYMIDFKPLSEKESEAVKNVVGVYRSIDQIQCTSCRYCIEQNECPMNIRIPGLFRCLNRKRLFENSGPDWAYRSATREGFGKASDCIECGGCESVCPQGLPIIELLKEVKAAFE